MLPSDRAHTFENAPLEDLLGVLLRQLKRPLATHGFHLTDADAHRLALERMEGRNVASRADLVKALAEVVAESEGVLARMGLTFQQALDADLSDVGGWETTAEFLELANEKANAELRITLGSALALAFGGERRFAADLLHLVGGDYGDETVIARRVLSFASGIEPEAADWLENVRAWAG
jgi:hypothetical protein